MLDIGTKIAEVIIVDDHPLFRRGVVELLNDSEQFSVIADYESAALLLADLEQLSADLILLDLHMPEISGLELLVKLKQLERTEKIVILTASDDSNELYEAIAAGADGYLLKDSDPDSIIDNLKSVLNGSVAIDADGITMLARHLSERDTDVTTVSSLDALDLTDREQQTLELITRGLSNKLIARELGISDGTVKVYVKNLLRKLNVNTRLELAAWAHSNNVIEEGE